jgi:Rrf2 family iron-sulfur cluster assembly transcriptional regulator
MKIITQSRLAIAAILDVAVHGTNKPVSLAGISKRQRVSLSYLEQLFKKLREKEFVASRRGPGGGYRLKRHLATISVADIINAVDSETFEHSSGNGTGRRHETQAGVTDGLWCRVNDHLYDYLRSVTLESVLADGRKAAGLRETSPDRAPMSRGNRVPPKHEEWSVAAIS